MRQAVAVLIDASLAAQDPNSPVKVVATGSQGYKDYTSKAGLYNFMNIAVEPLHGFVE